MGGVDNGLTLEGLAQRMEELEQENERMRSENAELRDEVAEVRGSPRTEDVEPAAEFVGPASVGNLLEQAQQREEQAQQREALKRKTAVLRSTPIIKADYVETDYLSARGAEVVSDSDHSTALSVKGYGVDARAVAGYSARGTGVQGTGVIGVEGWSGTAGEAAVYGTHKIVDVEGPGVVGDGLGETYAGILGRNSSGTGVKGEGANGVWGTSDQTGRSAVYGQHMGTRGFGVAGDGTGIHAGVLGRNSSGTGVKGEGAFGVVGDGKGKDHAGVLGRNNEGVGVWGKSDKTGYEGVYGQHTGSMGYGIVGDGNGETGAGVLGRNNEGVGVWGKSAKTRYGGVYGQHIGSTGYGIVGDGNGETGAGVLGRNSSGYGGQFEGGKAQLKLLPSTSAGQPTTGGHTKGELYMDSEAVLFVCTADGTPGTWSKFTTTPA